MTTKASIEDNPTSNIPPPASGETNAMNNNQPLQYPISPYYDNQIPPIHPIDQPFQEVNYQNPNANNNFNDVPQPYQNNVPNHQFQQPSYPIQQPQQNYPYPPNIDVNNYQQPPTYPMQQPQQNIPYPQNMNANNYQQPQYPPQQPIYPINQINQQMNVYNQRNYNIQQNQPLKTNQVTKPNYSNNILEKAVSAYVEQKFELLETITKCETQNEYYVTVKDKDGNKTLLFKAKEDSSCFCRFCCPGSCREFTLHLKMVTISSQGQQVKKDFVQFSRPFKCTMCCCGRPEMQGIYINDQQIIGKIREPCRFFSPKVNVFSNEGRILYTIVINCCQLGFYCRNTKCGRCSPCKFHIYNGSDTSGAPSGIVNKKVKGLKSLIGDADFYDIIFPHGATVDDKVLLIGAVIMIDYLYYEDKDDNDNVHHNIHQRRRYI